MRTIVISGINLYEGGPLSIYYDCLDAVWRTGLYKEYRIIAFVHKKELFQKYKDIVKIVELPKSRRSYMHRLYYEYIFFHGFSKMYHIDVWFSLHDMTPFVKADRIYTYCHNPGPFMKKDITKIKYSLKMVLFAFLYRYVYRINIASADAVIVQQDWMRKEFYKMYPVRNVIVARPDMPRAHEFTDRSRKNKKTVFIYAAYPRYFKNFEAVLDACWMLEHKEFHNFELWITIDGTENKYAKELYKKYSILNNVRWMGILDRNELFCRYEEADCLVFPSLLETWGLPVSEFKKTGKGMILADLPYAHEALGSYDKVLFFDTDSVGSLAKAMAQVIRGSVCYMKVTEKAVKEPYAENWAELFQMIL